MFGTFKTDPNAPIDVEADTLDVHDQAKQAIFRGNVKSQQGDFVVRTVEMTVFYTGQAGFGLPRSGDEAADKGGSQLTRVEARQKVLITSKDGQTATGDWANFDVKANTVLMGGHVVVSRGKDVAEGPRLKIDLTTGMYRFELESEAATARQSRPTSAAPALTGSRPCAQADVADRARPVRPASSACCSTPRTRKRRPRSAIKKVLPDARRSKASDGWQPSTSASPVQRSD